MTVGCAGAGNGISDTGGSLTFSGFASGEMKICLSFSIVSIRYDL